MIQTLQFMKTMFLGLDAKRRSEEGATAVEYALMVALIAVGIITAVVGLKTALSGKFGEVGKAVTNNGATE